MGDQAVAMLLLAQKTGQAQNKRPQTSILGVGLEPTTQAFERALYWVLKLGDRLSTDFQLAKPFLLLNAN
jgi:hypothetical protein